MARRLFENDPVTIVGISPTSRNIPSNHPQHLRIASEAEASQHDRLQDIHRLELRQKQVDFGRNTVGYMRYTSLIPRYTSSYYTILLHQESKNDE